MNDYYVYAYLRSNGTPYYIGKGINRRAYTPQCHYAKTPQDKSKIVFLNKNLSEDKAFEAEKLYIALFGRKDIKTGILRNLTAGGEGSSKRNIDWNGENNPFYGKHHSEETKAKLRKAKLGKPMSEEAKIKMQLAALKSGNHPPSQKGKKFSRAHKTAISKALTGRIFSEEHKKNISLSLNKKNSSLSH